MWRVARSLETLLGEINRSTPGRSTIDDGSIGDLAHQNKKSDHNPCPCHMAVCARDFTHDPVSGFHAHEFADWLANRLKMSQEHRVKYIISKGRICSGPGQSYRPGQWREYAGSNPHNTHIHVSVQHPKGVFDNTDPWGWEIHMQRSNSEHPSTMCEVL